MPVICLYSSIYEQQKRRHPKLNVSSSGEGGCRTYPSKSLSVAGFRRLAFSRSPIGPWWDKSHSLFLKSILNACFTKNFPEFTKDISIVKSRFDSCYVDLIGQSKNYPALSFFIFVENLVQHVYYPSRFVNPIGSKSLSVKSQSFRVDRSVN